MIPLMSKLLTLRLKQLQLFQPSQSIYTHTCI